MSHIKKRAEQVKREVPLGELLQKLGFEIDPNSNREQQFSCGLHGKDTKRSARFYPSTNSTYCWTCHKPRNSIDYVMEMEGVSFPEAISILESMFSLEKVPWEEEQDSKGEVIWDEDIKGDLGDSLSKLLTWITRDRILTMTQTLKYWEVFDLIQTLESSKLEKSFSQLRVIINNELAKGDPN